MILLPLTLNAQMLDNSKGYAFTDKPFFNKDFIRHNGIKRLNGQFTYKKPGEAMRTTEFHYVYTFDSLGRLSTTYETRKDDGTVDTTWNIYLYDIADRLLEHKRGDGKGFTSTLFEYDQDGNIIRESYVREYHDSLGQPARTILSSETMSYQDFGDQVKKTIYNSYGLPYAEEISFYNELGYLTSIEQRLIMTGSVTYIRYDYNDKGMISAIRNFPAGAESPAEETLFLYDEHGNLQDKHLYRNGVFTTEFEMIYNEKSKLLTYVLTRDVATNFIMILGFRDYSFYGR